MGFGLSMAEMLVIAVLVLVFFGPKRFPEIGRAAGHAMREFRRSLNEIQREFEEIERQGSIDGDARKGSPSAPRERSARAAGAPRGDAEKDPDTVGEAGTASAGVASDEASAAEASDESRDAGESGEAGGSGDAGGSSDAGESDEAGGSGDTPARPSVPREGTSRT